MLDGSPISQNDFPELELVENLMYYDGPLLDLYTDAMGHPVVRSWVDCDENRNVWALVWSNPDQIRGMIFNECALYDVFRDAHRILIYETKNSATPLNIREVSSNVLLKDHAPHPDSFLSILESERQRIWNLVLEHKLLKGI